MVTVNLTVEQAKLIVRELQGRRHQLQNILTDYVLWNKDMEVCRELARETGLCLQAQAEINGALNKLEKQED